MATKIVAVKLTETEHAALSQLVEQGYYKSYSAALREGFMCLPLMQKLRFETRLAIRQERLTHTMRKRHRDDGAEQPPG